MRTYWFGVIVDRIPDDFADGIVVADDLDEEGDLQPEQLQYVILARASSSTAVLAQALINKATRELTPDAFFLIADRSANVVRTERQLAAALGENDVSVKASFLGFRRGSGVAKATAIRILERSVTRRWWQFWR